MASKSTRREGFIKELSTYGVQAVPTGDTALSSTNTILFQIFVSNPTASGITLTVKDNQTVPVTIISTTIPANSVYNYNSDDGTVFLGGIRWNAGGAGLLGEVYGLAKATGA